MELYCCEFSGCKLGGMKSQKLLSIMSWKPYKMRPEVAAIGGVPIINKSLKKMKERWILVTIWKFAIAQRFAEQQAP